MLLVGTLVVGITVIGLNLISQAVFTVNTVERFLVCFWFVEGVGRVDSVQQIHAELGAECCAVLA